MVFSGLNRVSLNELRQVIRDDLVGIVENALVSMQMGRSASGTMTVGETTPELDGGLYGKERHVTIGMLVSVTTAIALTVQRACPH